jgi:predicted MFS family arabinose efflux permease
MHDIGAGWLMASLAPSPIMVALIQTATTLPIFLLAMPAGALSDIVDRRRYLIIIQVWMGLVATTLGALTLTGITTAWTLLVLTFAMGIGTAMMMPAWSAITPEIVPRAQLQPAIALNSLGINVARAIGPALAGFIISFAGTGAVFFLNALTYLGVIVVLFLWRRQVAARELPAERFVGAMRAGARFARHAPELQAAALRGLSFFLFASASWALLPLVAKGLDKGGPEAFGTLVASIGFGAVLGALALPRLRTLMSRDALVASATVAYSVATASLAFIDRLAPLCLAMAVSGMAWITVMSSLQVAAQMALPDWVRSRGLAVFMTIFMGSMAAGSVAWGTVAELTSISQSLLIAAAGMLLAGLLGMRWRISGFEDVDLSPSMHWPQPVVHDAVTHDRGPVLVSIEYRVRPEAVREFLDAVRLLGTRRRRDGAFTWGIYESTERPLHFIETFHVASWLEHLRQHERVTDADRVLQEDIRDLLTPGTAPIVSHYVAPNGYEQETSS